MSDYSELGLKRTDNADFYIDIQSRILQNGSNSSVGLGVGGTGNQVGGGVSVGIPLGQGNQVREIFIEFVDLKKDQMFWQAVSSDSFNQTATPEIREANFIAIVDKIFQKYPPGD